MSPQDFNLPAGTQPQPGDLVWSRYRIGEKLGSGAFGQVFAAEDLQESRRVAIKVLREGVGQRDPSAVARMRQEAEILGAIQHPNIVEIFDVGEGEFGLFMAMELLEGRSIAQLLKTEGPAAPERVAQVARQMLSALVKAHGRGVLHRDLKPANIMLVGAEAGDPEELAKLVDFGIAKAREILDDDPEEGVTLVKTRSGAFVGTPRYCAPELVVSDPVGPSADLFSLGLVLAEWMTGRERIDARNQTEALAILLQPEPLDVSDCPPDWQPWLAKMLAKFPSDRYATAEEALSEFERLVGEEANLSQLGAVNAELDHAETIERAPLELSEAVAAESLAGELGSEQRDERSRGQVFWVALVVVIALIFVWWSGQKLL